MTAATTVIFGAGPGGHRGDATAVGAEAPKLGSGPAAVGTGLGSTITAEATASANGRAMDPSCAIPRSDCPGCGPLLVVEGRYNAGRRVECGAYNCFHLTST